MTTTTGSEDTPKIFDRKRGREGERGEIASMGRKGTEERQTKSQRRRT